MLDEAHERNINTDIVIGLLKKVCKDTFYHNNSNKWWFILDNEKERWLPSHHFFGYLGCWSNKICIFLLFILFMYTCSCLNLILRLIRIGLIQRRTQLLSWLLKEELLMSTFITQNCEPFIIYVYPFLACRFGSFPLVLLLIMWSPL